MLVILCNMNSVTLDFGNVKPYAKSTNWYHKINANFGMKIFKDFSPLVELEFLITRYVYSHCLHSTNVLCCDEVKIGILDECDMPIGLHPVIYMEHLEGVTLEYCIEKVMKTNPHFLTDSYDESYFYAMENPTIIKLMKQYDRIIDELISIGLTTDDHDESFANFIVEDKSEILFAIDYSHEAQVASPELKLLVAQL